MTEYLAKNLEHDTYGVIIMLQIWPLKLTLAFFFYDTFKLL